MPIVVAHEPAYPVVGTAAYGVGRGMARERLEEQLQRRAEQQARQDFEARRMERQAQLQADRDQWQAEAEKAQREADFGYRAALEQYAQEGRFDLQEATERGRRETARDELQRKWWVEHGYDVDGNPLPKPKFSPDQEMARTKLAEEANRIQSDMTLDPMEKTVMLGKLNQQYTSIQPEAEDVGESFRREVIFKKGPDGQVVPWIRKQGAWQMEPNYIRSRDAQRAAELQAETRRAQKVDAAEKLDAKLKESIADGEAEIGFLQREIEATMLPIAGEDEDARRKRLDKVRPLQAKLEAEEISVQADRERRGVVRKSLQRFYGETLGIGALAPAIMPSAAPLTPAVQATPPDTGVPIGAMPEAPVVPGPIPGRYRGVPFEAGARGIGPVPSPIQEVVDFITGGRAAAARPPAPAKP